MKRPSPPPTVRQLTLALLAAGALVIVAAGLVLKASMSGAGWLSRAVAASERKD